MAASVPPALSVAGLVWVVLTIGGLGQALLQSAVVPDLDLLGRMALGAGGVAAGLAVPLGALGGVVGGARRLAEERAWLGLRTLGFSGRHLVPASALLLGVGAGIWLGISHFGEPNARAALRDARVEAAVRVVPVEGRTVTLGSWAASVDGEKLRFAGGDWLGEAETWSIRPAVAGVVVRLEGTDLQSVDGATRARIETLEMPIPLAAGGKVQAAERTTPDLQRQIAVSAALGRDAYERWILWKRSLLPLCVLPLGLGGLRLGLGSRVSVLGIVGGQVLTLWGAVRVADQAISSLGPVVAAALVGSVAVLWGVGWAWWRDA